VQGLVEQQQQTAQHPEALQPQPEAEAQLPAETQELLEELNRSPRLKAVLEKDLADIQQAHQGAEQARQQYAAATHQATQAAIHSMLAAIPEFHGIGIDGLPAALQVLKVRSPERYADAVSHLQRIDQLGRAAAQAQQQQQAMQQQQLNQWAQQQDQIFENAVKSESPETRRQVSDNVMKVMQSKYGLSPDELKQAYHTIPAMRSAAFQKMLYDLTKFHTLTQQVAEKRVVNVHPVQRPGTSQPVSREHASVEQARARFMQNPDDVKAAAAFIQAKRAARS